MKFKPYTYYQVNNLFTSAKQLVLMVLNFSAFEHAYISVAPQLSAIKPDTCWPYSEEQKGCISYRI